MQEQYFNFLKAVSCLPESEHTDGPVGFVAVLLGHGRAPEVVAEEADEVGGGPEVLVVLDGADVIEDEVAKVGVEVDDDDDDDDRQRQRKVPPHRVLPKLHLRGRRNSSTRSLSARWLALWLLALLRVLLQRQKSECQVFCQNVLCHLVN